LSPLGFDCAKTLTGSPAQRRRRAAAHRVTLVVSLLRFRGPTKP
jgi:hypothetical protein